MTSFKYKKTLILTILIGLLLWLLSPIYHFYAYRDKLPLPFWGWHEIPKNTPSDVKLHDPNFKTASDEALKLIQAHKEKIVSPAISAAVAIEGRLIWAAATGWEDISENKPITIDSRFRVGSTSKAINSIALARLIDAKKIELDKTIDHYLKPLPNSAWNKITPRMLASHSSGLPHYKENTDIYGLYRSIALNKSYQSMIDSLEVFDDAELLSESGTEFFYSSLGTVLLGAVMESVEQKDYFNLVNDLVFEPLDIKAIILAPSSSSDAPSVATSYKRDNQSTSFRQWRPVDLSHRLPAGGFAATSSDLVKLGSAFINPEFINPKTRQAFWQPQKLADGQTNSQNYAIGWRIANYPIDGYGVIMNANHGGVSRGAQSWLMVLPKYQMAIAININSKTERFWDFGKISMDIAKAFIDQIEKL